MCALSTLIISDMAYVYLNEALQMTLPFPLNSHPLKKPYIANN